MKILGTWLSVIFALLLIPVVLSGCGESNSSSIVNAPTAQTEVTITPGNTQATIAWPATPGANSYNIYWSTTSDVTPATGSKVTGASSPYTLTELTNRTTYYFVVSAVTADGESTLVAPVSTVPVPTISVIPAADNVFTVQADGFDRPAGFHLFVTYDRSRLSNPRVVPGSLTSGAMFTVNTNVPGVVQIAVVSANPMNGSGAVATISFDRTGDYPGSISVAGTVINVSGKLLPVGFNGWTDSPVPLSSHEFT